MNILFWVLVFAPIVLLITSYVYYVRKQNHFFPYGWVGIAFAFFACWIFALLAHLWIIGKIA